MQAETPLPPGLLISAPRSGAGKTTVTLGLLRAFADRGVKVQPFKCGPDYIDPAFHKAASGNRSCNLDSWAMQSSLLEAMCRKAAGTDLIIAEGAMGLFDGAAASGETGTGASADIATMMGWPVVLVLDVSGQAQSAAAIASGFAAHRRDVTLAGVILNNVASTRHEALVRHGMEAASISVFGALPRSDAVRLPERHLGLVQAGEHGDLEDKMQKLAAFMHDHVDLERLQAAARSSISAAKTLLQAIRPPGQRIALAQDVAFSFIYPHLVDGWRQAGTEIVPFSPLADEAPAADADVAWLPGGYPELHAGRIAGATRFLTGLHRFAETRPVHGECGGYMVLGKALIDSEGVTHTMAGLLGLVTSFAKRQLHLGYRLASIDQAAAGPLAGMTLRGHEFHYSTVIEQPDEPFASVLDANGNKVEETGSRRGMVSGTFFHMIAEAT